MINLTTPAVTLKPIRGGSDPTAVAADLRAIADLVEGDEHLATMIVRLFDNAAWPNHAVAYDQRDDPRGTMAATIRKFMPLATGPVEKRYAGDYFDAILPLKALKLRLTDERAQVCTRVVTGTEKVTEEVPDPAYIAAAPMVSQTREIETVEWECGPLMASTTDRSKS